MATSAAPPPLAERADIHKACKSFETLLSVFNDYCEAAGAVVTLQKKMAKALRETAGMKVTGEIAANALNASAAIFEVLSEVDTKFAKLADKEYDGVSGDVKKWFKKLAKEEKAHDERIAAANAKIKQAGQLYEKKSKKSPREANEEHARYINLISVMGPEISQEKYNHSLLVTQRHITTTYNIATSVSRIADAEWLRSCESVRRFASTIGKLSELRAFCEGGWTGPIPQDLRDVDIDFPPSPVEQDLPTPKRLDYDDEHDPRSMTAAAGKIETSTLKNIPSGTDLAADRSNSSPKPPLASPVLTPAQLQYQNRLKEAAQSSIPPSSFDSPRPFADSDNAGSVRSLSQFPAPPTHFPLPPPLTQRPSAASVSFPSPNHNRKLPGSEDIANTNAASLSSPSRQGTADKLTLNEAPKQQSLSDDGSTEARSPAAEGTRNQLSHSPTVSSSAHSSAKSFNRGDHISEEIDEEMHAMDLSRGSAKDTHEVARAPSTGSIVAAMRNRYDHNSRSTSPPPKDIPHLPLSVNDLATRYQSAESPSSPLLRSRPLSPNGSRPLPSINTVRQGEALRDHQPSPLSPANRPTTSESFSLDDERRRQQRMNELTELEIKGKELRLREREIELRSQELEREKALLMSKNEAMSTRESSGLDSMARTPLRPRERHLSFQQPGKPAMQRADNSYTSRPSSQYSASTTHLVPPPSSSIYERRSEDGGDSSSRDGSQTSATSTSNHAPYCGCENCSAAKYKVSASPVSSSPTKSDKEKTKGWMRRLSMPIVAGNAFLDSKKNKDSGGYGVGKGIMSLDSKKNASTTGLRNSITEDGRFGAISGRRSYDAYGANNRSMTNLGANARR
ncbi:hypothetical protein GYMLUDRAFT_41329 [Collybiopsis luxurians FD-317 M1]|uniref:Uncharacterized protein n=1 Tax=Collybiopsis luxurians FD-317 M1 TaxID=944289 RepID=A0A0D0CU66_9AGAR|nr:hypothetical protein GYMLUDRAFT_41329 [Collybiopsis luxurians FD-317 M1]